MKHLILIGCSRKKLTQAAPAMDLYCSPLFRAARAYAEKHGDAWAVLSAKHGVVLPETVLEPYDTTASVQMANGVWKTQCEYDRWLAEQIHSWALRMRKAGEDWRLTVLAGVDYTRCIRHLAGDISTPLEGMGVGQRLHWLKAMCRVEEVAPC